MLLSLMRCASLHLLHLELAHSKLLLHLELLVQLHLLLICWLLKLLWVLLALVLRLHHHIRAELLLHLLLLHLLHLMHVRFDLIIWV